MVSTVKKAVPGAGLVRGASISVTVEMLLVIQRLGSAFAHPGRLETSVTLGAGRTGTAPAAPCGASAPADPAAIPTTGAAPAPAPGWGRPAEKVALQSFLFMKNKLKKEGVFFQELYNSNIWTNK